MSVADMVLIGRVIKPHGVRGEVVVDATTDDPEGRFAVGTTLLGVQAGREEQLTVKTARPHQGRLLVRFEEIPGRNEAERHRGMQFYAEPVFEDGDFYDFELEGLRVVHNGTDIGEVTSIVRAPAHRLLEVTLDDGAREVLIPLVEDIVPEVDLENSTVTITPPEGLLEL
ncbi:ribosome maturation factor RimM [Corynebacterium jeikeium]|nr:ribosome maturation factor RimM [Corynebacterium jeikeium]